MTDMSNRPYTLQQIIFNVEQNGPNKGIGQFLNPIDNPRLEIQKFPLPSNDSKRNTKLIVIPGCKRNQAIFNGLRYIEDSGEIEGILFLGLALVDLADATYYEVLVVVPERIEDFCACGMILQVLGQQA